MKRIKKGDNVIVTAGRSKGHQGEVKKVLGDYVIVEGANMIKKHVKPNPNLQQDGGIVSRESKLHISNVSLCDSNGKPVKIGFKYLDDGKGNQQKVRYIKSTEEVIDQI